MMKLLPCPPRVLLAALCVACLPAFGQAPVAAPRGGDVLNADDWARLRGDSLVSPGAQGSEIFGSIAPSVVYIYAKLKPRGGKPAGIATGTGSILSRDGLILTNQHVVADTEALYVALFPPGGRRELKPEDLHQARLVRYDATKDLALIRLVQPPANLRPLPFGKFDAIKIGEEVHAIGHPLGYAWTYTKGVISQIRDSYAWQDSTGLKRNASVIQTQTPISPGNSGGPLLDAGGRLVGVNSFGSGERSAQGLNFAVAVSEVEQFLVGTANREAPTANDRPAAGEECKGRKLRDYRNSTDDHTFTDIDIDCDGSVDLTVRTPDNKALAVRYTIDEKGRTTLVMVSLKRDNKIDYSLHDTDGDGVPDRIGVHVDGDFKPASFVPYAGEASVRAVLQQRRN
jgi:S1-C subfamily serine protease